MDGEAYLRTLIEERLRGIAIARGEAKSLVAGIEVQEVHGAAGALVSAGALEAPRAAEILRQFHAALLKRQVVEQVHVSARAKLVLEATGPGGEVAEPPPEWAAILEEPSAPELLRVIPLVRDLGMTPAGFSLALISLEIWTDGMELRYSRSSRPTRRNLREALRGREDRPLRDIESLVEGWGWEAWDDAGTIYESRGGGGGDRDGVWVAARRFRPTPPPGARHVTLVARGDEGEYARAVIDLQTA